MIKLIFNLVKSTRYLSFFYFLRRHRFGFLFLPLIVVHLIIYFRHEIDFDFDGTQHLSLSNRK